MRSNRSLIWYTLSMFHVPSLRILTICIISFTAVGSLFLFWGFHHFGSTSQTADSATLTPQSPLPLPNSFVDQRITRYECQINAVVQSNQSWLEACYFQNSITSQCKGLFGVGGQYIPYKIQRSTQMSLLKTYYANESMCACKLPASIATTFNSEASFLYDSCSDYPGH
jgi:hypothetical protein